MRAAYLFGAILLATGLFFIPAVEIQIESPQLDEGVMETKEEEPLSLIFAGDIMLGRNVQLLGERYGEDYPFEKVKDLLGQYDIVVGNLEGPIVLGAPRTMSYSFKFAFPTSSPGVLKAAGFNLLSLANNHTVDFGSRGYEETVARLSEEGINSFGHPISGDAFYVRRLEQNGKNLAFFGYNATYPSFKKDQTLSDVAAERISSSDELIFIFMHWGEEYSSSSNAFQKQLGRELVDAGATAVIGSHPHVVQEFEIYKNRPIFYSLGNFIFDQYFSEETQEGLMVSMKIFETKIVYEFLPIVSVKSQPANIESAFEAEWFGGFIRRSGIVPASYEGGFELPL
ncbi:MAG: hypothetical protein LiPW15_444 [Parcubacteria group bacterium LiPW_15]|nr:MAG: hypothetical protein LiPW15_444 [Parcubacteria group bacterium LiPW_15]